MFVECIVFSDCWRSVRSWHTVTCTDTAGSRTSLSTAARTAATLSDACGNASSLSCSVAMLLNRSAVSFRVLSDRLVYLTKNTHGKEVQSLKKNFQQV